MKYSTIAFILIAALAACGSGGSAPTIPTQPGNGTAPTSYAVGYSWVGAMQARGTVATASLHTMQTAATPEPVQLAAQPCSNPIVTLPATPPPGACGTNAIYNYLGSTQPGSRTANVYAVVAPSQNPSIVPSWAPIPTNAPISVPVQPAGTPTPSPTPGVLTIISTAKAGATTLSGMVPIPSAPQTVSPLVYVFPSVALSCAPSVSQGTVQGVSFQQGSAVSVNSPSQADMYVDGPACAGNYANAAETTSMVHFPGGAQWFSTNASSFIGVTSAMWSNSFSAVDFPTMGSDVAALNNMVEFQTHAGGFVRMFFVQSGPISAGNGLYDAFLASYDQSGYSITGTH